MRKKQDLILNNKGSSTVEASMIVPLVLFIILAFVYIGFYFMDVAKIYAISDLVSVYASDSISKSRNLKVGSCDIKWRNQQNLYRKEFEKQLQETQAILNEQLQLKTVAAKVERVSVKKSGSAIEIETNYTANRAIWRYFGISSIVMRNQSKIELGDFADTLRKKAVVEDVVRNGR